jgi:hypothetical protein
MATIEEALARGILEDYALPEWETRPPIRSLHMPPEFFDWVDNTAELYDQSRMIGRRTLYDHLVLMLNEFRCAPSLGAGDLRRMMPTSRGIWKMHPNGLRLYGWCYRPHAMVVVTGALADDTKKVKRLNDNKSKEVVDFARRHGLIETILRGDHREIFPK